MLGREHLRFRFAGLRRRPLSSFLSRFSGWNNNSRGFTMVEMMLVVVVGTILAAMAIPVTNAALTTYRLNSAVTAMSSAISNTRYRAIKDSQIYTLVLSTPANTYVVTNTGTGTADPAVPLPNPTIAFNGGSSATFTFTLCPNGTAYGTGATCPGNSTPPALAATYQGSEIDLDVSTAGNVNSKTIH